jgi:cytochrome d ubiquinol oxidase subunit II
MFIETLWFYLWGLLWGIYFITDGFDLGIGMLLPFLGKDEISKRTLYNTTGPLWDGNEVWLITAGGVTFAAFPKTYAVMFSSFYIALTLLLAVLIVRGISLEYRNKVDSSRWKGLCDICQFVSSGLIALLIGVAFANIFRGIPIQNGVFKGSFWGLLSPYGICGGIFFIAIFLQHGALWLLIKTEGSFQRNTRRIASALWLAVLVITVAFLVYSYIETNLYANYLKYPVLFIIPLLAVAALLACRIYTTKNAAWKAWLSSATFILACTFFCIIGLFPNMLPSTIDPAVNNITYRDAASSPLTLKVMLGVILVFIPLVLGYQIWAYMLFSKKIKPEELVY